jgi:hypothetical protein
MKQKLEGAASDARDRALTSRSCRPYMRRSKSIETLLPIHYLKGLSTGDFSEARGPARQGCAGADANSDHANAYANVGGSRARGMANAFLSSPAITVAFWPVFSVEHLLLRHSHR